MEKVFQFNKVSYNKNTVRVKDGDGKPFTVGIYLQKDNQRSLFEKRDIKKVIDRLALNIDQHPALDDRIRLIGEVANLPKEMPALTRIKALFFLGMLSIDDMQELLDCPRMSILTYMSFIGDLGKSIKSFNGISRRTPKGNHDFMANASEDTDNPKAKAEVSGLEIPSEADDLGDLPLEEVKDETDDLADEMLADEEEKSEDTEDELMRLASEAH